MFKSLRSAFGLVLSLAVFITTATVLLIVVNEHDKRYIAQAEQRAHALSVKLVSELRPLLERENWTVAELQDVLTLSSGYNNIIALTLFDADYQPLVSLDGKQATLKDAISYGDIKPSRYILGTFPEDGYLVSVDRIGNTVYPLGYVMVVFDTAGPLAQSKKALVVSSLPYIGLFLVISLVAYLFLVHRWLSSVSGLAAFLRNVNQSKDYTLRYPQHKQREIARLAESVNELLDIMETELTINYEQNQTLVEQQQTMTRLANYDSLTGLPNRQFVMDNLRLELARAKRHQEDLVLMFFDLDGFKGINDSLGHETGDLILIEVADRVTTLLREGDLIARLGGDEFIVLPDRDTSDASIQNMADRLISAFSEPFQLRGLALNVGISMGVAKASDADYDLSQLMSNADLAMYRSKAKGRGVYTVFTPDMVESYKRKLSIANSIDQGLMNSEFIVYYQPKVATDGQIVGFEALLRWIHPEFGMIMPGEFIPVAEQGGKITSLTRYVIEQVCIQLPLIENWIKRRFTVAVNLSGHDLRDNRLFDSIHQMFIDHNVKPENIEFEVTESAYLENFALSNKFFKRVSNMGCAISLDDFGTGYSSLSYLTQISIDTLKIDRQFISEIGQSERSRLVTGAIIDLAKRLSLNICAEGIETVAQWDYLLNHGVDHLQGYLFSKPVPLDELQTLPLSFNKETLAQAQ